MYHWMMLLHCLSETLRCHRDILKYIQSLDWQVIKRLKQLLGICSQSNQSITQTLLVLLIANNCANNSTASRTYNTIQFNQVEHEPQQN